MKRQARKHKRPLAFRSRISKSFYNFLPVFGLLLFVVYKAGFMGQPFANISFLNTRSAAQQFRPYVCSNVPESEHDKSNPYKFESDLYKTKIVPNSKAVNLVKNSTFTLFNNDTHSPAAFVANTEATHTSYSVEHEKDSVFLRTVQNVRGSQPISGTWLQDTVPLGAQKTYGFQVVYRSTVDSTISVELTLGNGSLRYERDVVMQASHGWKVYTGYFDNTLYAAKAARIIVSPNDKGMLDTRGYTIYELPAAQLAKGLVSVTFDDGWRSIYTAGRPLFKKYDIKTTQYIIAENTANNVREYMTIGEVKTLAKEGHEIGSHSLRHCDQTTLSPADLLYDTETSKRVLTDAGVSVTGYAYPYGAYNDQTMKVMRQHYALLRSSDDGFNNRYFDPLNIRTKAVYEQTSTKEIQAWLNEAKAERQWLVLMYHRINETGDYTVSSKELDVQLKMIHDSGLQSVTVTQATKLIH